MLIWNHLEFCIISSKISFVYSVARIILLLQTFEQIKISFLEKSYSVYVRNCYQTQVIAKLQVKYVNEKCFNLVLRSSNVLQIHTSGLDKVNIILGH